MAKPKDKIIVAALGDLHCRAGTEARVTEVLARACERADVLALCGDLTDFGKPEEAKMLARALTSTAKVPVVGVLGNHDYECDNVGEVQAILADAGVNLLDGEIYEAHGIGFAGVKGFAGGFGQGMLQGWGEPSIKSFVREAVDEGLKLERALGTLRTSQRVALMHYSPIVATLEGEPREIFPFLGSSRLEDPLNRFPVTVALHGHAHRGAMQGQTAKGVPVYNVAVPLLMRETGKPYRLIELPALQASDAQQLSLP